MHAAQEKQWASVPTGQPSTHAGVLLISADAQDYIRFDFTLTAALASTARDSATDSRQVCQGVNHPQLQ